MKKTIVAFCILSMSIYISAAEQQINANTTFEDLMKILEARNEQHRQRCRQIVEDHQNSCNQIGKKQKMDVAIIEDVLTQPGAILNPYLTGLCPEPSKLTANAVDQVMD